MLNFISYVVESKDSTKTAQHSQQSNPVQISEWVGLTSTSGCSEPRWCKLVIYFPITFVPSGEWRNVILWSIKPFNSTAFWLTEKCISCGSHVSIPLDWVCTTKRKSPTNLGDAAQTLGFHSLFSFSPLHLQKCRGVLWNPPNRTDFNCLDSKINISN